ncbi:MAG: BrnT family toxin [Deltaproteobacteria bacterium]|nr:BrnT family toxin [Deltaproteobacteria bacterium]MBI4795894.1 BrnT family toxin [Deltaproteobacteria bacterium]
MDVIEVFEAPHIVVPSAHESEEDRFLAIGIFKGRLVAVVFTTRSEAFRIISFRRARHEERQTYQELYGRGA